MLQQCCYNSGASIPPFTYDSEISHKKQLSPLCVQYITWFWFTRYRKNTRAPYLSQGAPHPNSVAIVPAPMVPCARSLEKEYRPLTADTLVPHTVNTDAEIDKVPTSLRPVLPPHTHNQCRWCPLRCDQCPLHTHTTSVDGHAYSRVGISGTTTKSRQRKIVPSSHPGPFALVASSRKSQTKVGTLACFNFL